MAVNGSKSVEDGKAKASAHTQAFQSSIALRLEKINKTRLLNERLKVVNMKIAKRVVKLVKQVKPVPVKTSPADKPAPVSTPSTPKPPVLLVGPKGTGGTAGGTIK